MVVPVRGAQQNRHAPFERAHAVLSAWWGLLALDNVLLLRACRQQVGNRRKEGTPKQPAPAEEEPLVLLLCHIPPDEGVTQPGWPVDQLVVDTPAVGGTAGHSKAQHSTCRAHILAAGRSRLVCLHIMPDQPATACWLADPLLCCPAWLLLCPLTCPGRGRTPRSRACGQTKA